MIRSVAQLLAQAKRAGHAVPFCEVSTSEQVQACLEAVTTQQSALVLTLAATTNSQLDRLPKLLAITHWMAHHAPSPIALELRVSSMLVNQLEVVLGGWHEYGALTLSVPVSFRALPPGVDVIGILGAQAPLTNTYPYIALRMSTVPANSNVPVILEEAEYTPLALERIVQAGVVGITLSSQLDASFTAGIRAGLRNRELHSPALYLQQGQLAVRERVRTYIGHL